MMWRVDSKRKKGGIERKGVGAKGVDMDEEGDKDIKTKMVFVCFKIELLEMRNRGHGDLDGRIRDVIGPDEMCRSKIFEDAVKVDVCGENVFEGWESRRVFRGFGIACNIIVHTRRPIRG